MYKYYIPELMYYSDRDRNNIESLLESRTLHKADVTYIISERGIRISNFTFFEISHVYMIFLNVDSMQMWSS